MRLIIGISIPYIYFFVDDVCLNGSGTPKRQSESEYQVPLILVVTHPVDHFLDAAQPLNAVLYSHLYIILKNHTPITEETSQTSKELQVVECYFP